MAAFLLVFLVVAGVQLFNSYRFSGVLFVGKEIGRSGMVSAETVETFVPQAVAIQEDGVCRSDIVKAGATVLLRDISHRDAGADYEAWEASLSRADNFITYALSCLPTSGNMWLRLAMVRREVAESPQEIADLLTMSHLYEPLESEVLAVRYEFMNRLQPDTLDAANASVEADLRLICAMRDGRLRRQLSTPGEALRAFAARHVPLCEQPFTEMQNVTRLRGTTGL